jgi:hypothetical protein
MSEVLRQEISDLRAQVAYMDQTLLRGAAALNAMGGMLTHLMNAYTIVRDLIEREKIPLINTPEGAQLGEHFSEIIKHQGRFKEIQAEMVSLQRKYNEEV